MSIVNAWIERDKALVAVNTAAASPDGRTYQFEKLWALPCFNAVITYRGPAIFFVTLRHSIDCAMPGSFEELAQAIPERFPTTFEAVDDAYRKNDMANPNAKELEVLLVGWSVKRNRMLGYQFIQHASKGFIERELDPAPPAIGCFAYSPDDEAPTAPEQLSTVLGMVAFARRQKVVIDTRHAGMASGGRLTVARLRRDRMELLKACDLDKLDGEAQPLD